MRMNKLKSMFKAKEMGVLLALAALCLIFSLAAPKFFTMANLLNVTRQMAVISLVSIAMTFVIITGGIDLSVGSIIAFAGICAAAMMANGVPMAAACLLTIAIGGLVGLVNSVFIARLDMSPFITTLGTMTILRGLGFLYTGGYPIYDLPREFIQFGQGYFLGVPIPTIVLLAVAAAAHVTLRYTSFGRHVYAVGGNRDAALFSGVKVVRVNAWVYILSGLICALAAILQTSRVGSALPTMGQGNELDAIAAVIIGGAAMSGGSGTILGTILGSAILGVLNNGLSLLNVNSYLMQVITGMVVILAILIDKVRGALTRRSAVMKSRESLLRETREQKEADT